MNIRKGNIPQKTTQFGQQFRNSPIKAAGIVACGPGITSTQSSKSYEYYTASQNRLIFFGGWGMVLVAGFHKAFDFMRALVNIRINVLKRAFLCYNNSTDTRPYGITPAAL